MPFCVHSATARPTPFRVCAAVKGARVASTPIQADSAAWPVSSREPGLREKKPPSGSGVSALNFISRISAVFMTP